MSNLIINISDAKVSKNSEDTLVTYSLGSCIGVSIHDSIAGIAGMLHYQLPESKINQQRAQACPFMFADTGMKVLVEKILSLGATKKNLVVKIAGGAAMENGPLGFDIGKRNYLAIRKILWKNGMIIKTEDVGGSLPRNLYLRVSDGAVMVRSKEYERSL